MHSPTNVTCAPPLNWPWYEIFDYLFANIAKIDGIPHGVDQGVHTTDKEIDIMSVYYKNENLPKICKIILHPLSPMMQTYAFGDGFVLPSYSY